MRRPVPDGSSGSASSRTTTSSRATSQPGYGQQGYGQQGYGQPGTGSSRVTTSPTRSPDRPAGLRAAGVRPARVRQRATGSPGTGARVGQTRVTGGRATGQPGYGAWRPAEKSKLPWISAGSRCWLVIVIAVVLVLTLGSGGPVSGSSSRTVAIPDANPAGITDTIGLSGSGTVTGLQVSVAIQHRYTCDLVVSLRSPSGTSTTLADSESCSRSNPNLNLQLDSRQGGPLTSLVGQSVDGTWTLQVVDNTGVDVGSLTSWSITARRESGARTRPSGPGAPSRCSVRGLRSVSGSCPRAAPGRRHDLAGPRAGRAPARVHPRAPSQSSTADPSPRSATQRGRTGGGRAGAPQPR